MPIYIYIQNIHVQLNCNLEELALWVQKKGLNLISTGDFTHPAWFNEIKEKLVPAGNGF